jgi:integrase
MGSIVKTTRVDKATGKTLIVFRAHVRREGFGSRSKVCKTQREADKWMRENDATAALRKTVSRETFSALLDDFVEAKPIKGTKYWTAPHVEFWRTELGSVKVAEIMKGDINRGRARLQTKHDLTNATINRYLASLASVLNYAVAYGILAAHPMKAGAVEKLPEGKGRTRILDADEEARLFDAARASSWPMMYLFVRLALTSAARKSELLGLRWQDIRFDESIAILSTTKNGEARALPLVSDVLLALEAEPRVSEFVFYDPRHPNRTKNIATVWTACRKAAGLLKDRVDPLDRVYLHSTRHTAVTKMIKGGANLAQAAAVSGHKTLAMLKRYEHLAAADSVELAERLLK